MANDGLSLRDITRTMLRLVGKPLSRFWFVVGAPLLTVVILIGFADLLFALYEQGHSRMFFGSGWRTLEELLPYLRGLAGVCCVSCWMLAAYAVHNILHRHDEMKLISQRGRLAQAEYILMVLQGLPVFLLSPVAMMSMGQWFDWGKGYSHNSNPVLEASFVVSLFTLPMLWTLLLLAVGIGQRWVLAWLGVFAVLPQVYLPLHELTRAFWSGPNSSEYFYVHTMLTWKYLYSVFWIVAFFALRWVKSGKVRLGNSLISTLLLGGFLFSWNGPFKTVFPVTDALSRGFHTSPINYALDFLRAIAENIWHPLARGYFTKDGSQFGMHVMVPLSFQSYWPYDMWMLFPLISALWLGVVVTLHLGIIDVLMRPAKLPITARETATV